METKIWTVATDTDNGTETHTFHTEEALNDFMHGFLADYWRLPGKMPANWNDAWEAMGRALDDMNSFQTGEINLHNHPALIAARNGLELGVERLEMNDYGGEELPYIGQLQQLIQELTPLVIAGR